MAMIKLIECPRDAMQGIEQFIPTETKIEYLNALLQVGFSAIDFGSFVSHKTIPQLRDTAEVVTQLNMDGTRTKLLAIVANTRGAQDALHYDEISYLGFPLSISETFQRRNTNKSIAEALNTVEQIQNFCISKGRSLVVYVSMAFGNPYGDPYDSSIVMQFVELLETLGIPIVSLADTVGTASVEQVNELMSAVINDFAALEIGAHLHAQPVNAVPKIAAAYAAGCRRFDGALNGYGGCPMADNVLVGNLATEEIVSFLESKGEKLNLDRDALSKALRVSSSVFLPR
jgi:hydroxymethylglutaryl-CoA lyase